MKSEDTRNLFVAAALSLLVMIAWQYFYAGPLYQREHQAQMQANQVNNPPPASEAQPSATPGCDRLATRRPCRRHPAGRFGRDRAGDSQRGAGGEPACDYRHAERRRLDRPQGRQDRRYCPQGLSRDDRPEEPEHPAFLAARRARRLLGRDGICEPGRGPTPTLDTLWTADRQTLTPSQPVTLTWDNGASLVFKRVVAVDDKYMFTITDSVVNSGAAAATVQSYGLILRHGRPNIAGYSVLHEGFVGVITGDGASQVALTLPVQEVTYSAIEKDTGRVRAYKGDGGWLGFTDKYWGSAVIPDQTAPIEARFSASGTVQPVDYQADFLGKEQTVAPGSFVRDDRPASSPARKRSVRSTITSPISASRSSL